jgi:hypothetical protein
VLGANPNIQQYEATAGISGFGGGGGGAAYNGPVYGNAMPGGSGIVVVRYSSPTNAGVVATGQTRFNSDTGRMDVYDGTAWVPMVKTVVQFTSTGRHRWTPPPGVTKVDVLVVAGGGGGGYCSGGGGGGGGLVEVNSFPVVPGIAYPVVVGIGGKGQAAYDTSGNIGGQTSDIRYFGQGRASRFGELIALGGGHGGGRGATPSYTGGGNGGSGGGGHPCGVNSTTTNPITGNTGGAGIQPNLPGFSGSNGFGNPGGGTTASGNVKPGGGGGGAGGAGAAPAVHPGPKGGPGTVGEGGLGRASTITGTSITFAGGGGGGGAWTENVLGAAGGPGGGGRGSGTENSANGNAAQAGQVNTGGGGGGGQNNNPNNGGIGPENQMYGARSSGTHSEGADGGPGIVIIRY